MKLDGVDFYQGHRHTLELYDDYDYVGPFDVTIDEQVRTEERFKVISQPKVKLLDFLSEQFLKNSIGLHTCIALIKVWEKEELYYDIVMKCVAKSGRYELRISSILTTHFFTSHYIVLKFLYD